MLLERRENFCKVSVIIPFYCAEEYLGEAIQSVINQSHANWELLLVNDGSTDRSKVVARSYNDSRIRYFEQENRGVSAARNVGLSKMAGDFFCFLDADDCLTTNSLSDRLKVFCQDSSIEYVDGTVLRFDSRLKEKIGQWTPQLIGSPFSDLIRLGQKSFFGPSWMVKRVPGKTYYLKEGLSHGEDLLFYMQLARCGGQYGYVDAPILWYRLHSRSAMKHLEGLENGYNEIYEIIRHWTDVKAEDVKEFRRRSKQVMIRSYLRSVKISKALSIFLHWRGKSSSSI